MGAFSLDKHRRGGPGESIITSLQEKGRRVAAGLAKMRKLNEDVDRNEACIVPFGLYHYTLISFSVNIVSLNT